MESLAGDASRKRIVCPRRVGRSHVQRKSLFRRQRHIAVCFHHHRAPRSHRHDVQIEILFCGICHSDLHQARNEWSGVMPTVYPCVPGHEIVGRVTKVGSAVTKFKPGDLAAVGCLVDSDGTCPECKAGFEQFCPNFTLTYNFPDKHTGGVTYGGYSDSIVVTERFVLRVRRTSISPEPRRCSAPESPPTRPCATGA
jgi:D-arabinose 1-dehydrogenase-like Zn-dependent alcohol dehydrogenase